MRASDDDNRERGLCLSSSIAERIPHGKRSSALMSANKASSSAARVHRTTCAGDIQTGEELRVSLRCTATLGQVRRGEGLHLKRH